MAVRLLSDVTGGLFNVDNGTSGTYSFCTMGPLQNFGGSPEASAWKITFTSFGLGESFAFNWDPDCCGDNVYGATVSELTGTKISIGTAMGDVGGVLAPDGRGNLFVGIASPVPEPSTVALFGFAAAFVLHRSVLAGALYAGGVSYAWKLAWPRAVARARLFGEIE
jgi:hypothetical protein